MNRLFAPIFVMVATRALRRPNATVTRMVLRPLCTPSFTGRKLPKSVRAAKYKCKECGDLQPQWHGRCPSCSAWNSLEAYTPPQPTARGSLGSSLSSRSAPMISAVSLSEAARTLGNSPSPRVACGIAEFDRVLGDSGTVKGALVLVGGEPGIGKSTLMMQVARGYAHHSGLKVLYVSGEESLEQVSHRFHRLHHSHDPSSSDSSSSSSSTSSIASDANQEDHAGERKGDVLFASETSFSSVEQFIRAQRVDVVMVDSLQTMQDNDDSLSSSLSLPGSVSQMKRVADGFLQLCKSTGVVAFLIGHVTKAHEIAGPKMLEHLVDTVVFFEGERGDQHRLVKTHKNRFGPTSEVGIFAMSPKGLVPVRHPSSFFVHARGPGQPLPPGAALTCILEGSRPMIVEMQALAVRAGPNNSPIGRAVGVEPNRMTLVAAVLDAHLKTGLLSRHYHYVSVVGGLRVFEPGIDLAMAAALLSSVHGVPVPPKSLFIGEIGLTGEVRGVPNVDKRVSEALSMGMEIVVVPQDSADHVNHKHAHGGKARVVSCASVHDLAKVLGITVDSSRADDASSEGYKAYGRRRRRAHSPEDSDDVELHG